MAKTRKSSKAFFDPVGLKVDFPQMEKSLVEAWYKKGVVKKYLSRNKNSKEYFSFMDGPITANNPMGVHHAWGRTYKDLWQKFKNMQGFRQRFQNGFDCQGLWVEVEVEKELGFKSKKDIEEFGVAKFVQLCRDRVEKYSKIQTEQTKRLGNFMDWEHSYYTLSDDNNYMIWHFLKKCFDNGWIYKGLDSVPWCPRCETAISQHEMLTEDYKEVVHESVFLAFPLVGQDEEYLMVWTTTPWTVPANIAIAVDPDLEYSQIELENRKYWLASEAKERVLAGAAYKVIKTVRGSKLVGLRYKTAFDDLPKVAEVAKGKNDKFHIVIATDSLIMPITTTEGTGLVHTAVSAGIEDFKLGKKLGLPIIPVIQDNADYMEGLGFLTGQNAKKHPELILDYLRKLEAAGKHFYYKIENYKHRYPACWRCKTELVWKITDEWYIAMDMPAKHRSAPSESEDWDKDEKDTEMRDTRTLRERMKTVAAKINWIPEFGLDRELDWLSNMHDWLISKKNRYWGLALPIWECKNCGNFEVIGSKSELETRAVEGWKEFKNKSPHKPQIDLIKIKCSKCGSISSRIEPVGNPWLDAGIVPFSTISDNNQAANFKPTKTRPLYITDKKAWNNWFPVDFITESFPGQFKNWFYSLIAMSTVLEDLNPMKTVLGFATQLGEDGRPMHKSWGNAIEFNEGADKIGVDVMRWMAVRQNPAENMLFGYKTADEVRRRFHLKLWNVYNFFVTYANLDGWHPAKDRPPRKSSNILDKWILARISETTKLVTLGLERFDAYSASAQIERFVDDFSLWFIRRSRNRVGPAAEGERDRESFYNTTYFVLIRLSTILAPFMPFLPEIIYKNLTKEESVHLANWPKSKPLSDLEKRIISEMSLAREVVEKAHAIRKEKNISVKQPLSMYFSVVKSLSKEIEDIVKDEINVKNITWSAKTDRFDTKITAELREEAAARELVRSIQEQRKQMGLSLAEKVDVMVESLPKNSELIDWIQRKAQVAKLAIGKFRVTRSR